MTGANVYSFFFFFFFFFSGGGGFPKGFSVGLFLSFSKVFVDGKIQGGWQHGYCFCI